MSGLDDVYRKFGEVSEAAQLFETELGNILLTIEGAAADLFSGDRQEEAREILRSFSPALGRDASDRKRMRHGGAWRYAGPRARGPRPTDHWWPVPV